MCRMYVWSLGSERVAAESHRIGTLMAPHLGTAFHCEGANTGELPEVEGWESWFQFAEASKSVEQAAFPKISRLTTRFPEVLRAGPLPKHCSKEAQSAIPKISDSLQLPLPWPPSCAALVPLP